MKSQEQCLVSRVGFGLAVGLAGSLLAGCSSLAVWSAPEKVASTERTPQARTANDQFWRTLHGGRYEELPQVLDALTAVYLQNPNDAETAAHIGFSHIWRVSERARLTRSSPTITDEMVLSRKYFSEAVQLAPHDSRFLGFLGSAELAEGAIHGDEKLTRRGYFTLREAKDAWPEFNLFTIGYSLSGLPITDAKYRDAVDYQWQTLDVCAGERVDRKTVDYARYMPLETRQGPKRACWNSWIAPHNFEGFFLNMGDMLVKSGDWQTGQKIYATARLTPDYARWTYRDVLEERIRQAQANVLVFNAAEIPGDRKQGRMMVNSEFACMACHLN